jgi:septum site-determining protein MinC
MVQDLLVGHDMVLWTVLADRAETKAAARNLGLATRLPGSHSDLDGNVLKEPPEMMIDQNSSAARSTEPPVANGLLLHETLRSGQAAYHEGHVIVVGDVNPGAEIISGGTVIVWGKLRGLVHAGAHGDYSAMICALELNPTQLRIADQIAISPGQQRRNPIPEQASIQDDQIVAEAWQTKR